jgi:hypothetical protein
MTPSVAPELASNAKTCIRYPFIRPVFGLRGEFFSMSLPCSEPSDVRNLKRQFCLTPKVIIKNNAQAQMMPPSDNFFSFDEESLPAIMPSSYYFSKRGSRPTPRLSRPLEVEIVSRFSGDMVNDFDSPPRS